LTNQELCITTACFAILFEEGFPQWSPHFTKDYYDYLAYAGGAFIFYYFKMNKPLGDSEKWPE